MIIINNYINKYICIYTYSIANSWNTQHPEQKEGS